MTLTTPAVDYISIGIAHWNAVFITFMAPRTSSTSTQQAARPASRSARRRVKDSPAPFHLQACIRDHSAASSLVLGAGDPFEQPQVSSVKIGDPFRRSWPADKPAGSIESVTGSRIAWAVDAGWSRPGTRKPQSAARLSPIRICECWIHRVGFSLQTNTAGGD